MLIRAVRVASQVERRRWSAATACWLSDLTGTGRASSFRAASSRPLASVRSVLLRGT